MAIFAALFFCMPKSLSDEQAIFMKRILRALLFQILAATFLKHTFPTQDVEDVRT
jgi:hypothetical protein